MRRAALGTGLGGMRRAQRAASSSPDSGEYTLAVNAVLDDSGLAAGADDAVFAAKQRLHAVNQSSIASSIHLATAMGAEKALAESARQKALMAQTSIPLAPLPTFRERIQNRIGSIWDRARATRGGGTRKNYFEFGAEGVRAGDLRLSRTGLSLSEKTFVGSRGLGYAAVAGQLLGHAAEVVATHSEKVKERKKYGGADTIGGFALGRTYGVDLAVFGEQVGAKATSLIRQGVEIFSAGGRLPAAAMIGIDKILNTFGFDNPLTGGASYASLRDEYGKALSKHLMFAYDRAETFKHFREEIAKFHTTRRRERSLEATFWDTLYDRLENEYGSSPEAQIRYLRAMHREGRTQSNYIFDVRGKPAFKALRLSEQDGK